jgi:hypothetical protein
VVHDDVQDIVPGLEGQPVPGGSPEVPSSLGGSVDVCTVEQVLLHRSKCLDMWK